MEALLQEALDEFDEDEPPAPPAEAATGSHLQLSPAPAPTPVPETASPATEPVLDAECDDLARQLMEGLNMGGGGGGGGGGTDDMEQTLKALARSAETLAHDSPDGGGADPMELLKQMYAMPHRARTELRPSRLRARPQPSHMAQRSSAPRRVCCSHVCASPSTGGSATWVA